MAEHDDTLALEEVEHGATIRVTAGEGINLQMNARVEDWPDHIYKVLTDPESATIFRSIQACTDRAVLEEDTRKGTRKLAVTHKTIVKFLVVKVTFETHLIVWEDDRERTIRFMNAREGFMKRFEGNWHIRPFNQHSLDMATRLPVDPAPGSHHMHMPGWMHPSALLTAAQRLLHVPHDPSVSLVTLEQHIATTQHQPPPVRSFVRRLVSKQLRDMMEDLRNELERRAKAKIYLGTQGHHVSKVSSPAGHPSHKATPAPTASITGSALPSIWQHIEPLIDITIQL